MQKFIVLVLDVLLWTMAWNTTGITSHRDVTLPFLSSNHRKRQVQGMQNVKLPQHAVSSTSYANVKFGSAGSYKSFTEHPTHSLPKPVQSEFFDEPSIKTKDTIPSKQTELRSPRAVARSRGLPRREQSIQGGIDFSDAKRTSDGRLCVIKEKDVKTISKSPIMKCTIKNVETCPYSYNVEFKPVQEKVCDENFESKCQITFKMEPSIETVRKCNKPIQKVCDGRGVEECKTVYETHCSTTYVKNQHKKFVGDTKCEKKAIEMCGKGCTSIELKEQCQDKKVTTMVKAPQMDCNLIPRKTCQHITKMVPSLKPTPKCQIIPKETCSLDFSSPHSEKKPTKMEFCLDEGPLQNEQTYLDYNSLPYGRN